MTIKSGSIFSTVVIGLAFILAAFLSGGLYVTGGGGPNSIFMWRTNRFTGTTFFCSGVSDASVYPIRAGCRRLRDYDLLNATKEQLDMAFGQEYIDAHPEFLKSLQRGSACPKASPSPRSGTEKR